MTVHPDPPYSRQQDAFFFNDFPPGVHPAGEEQSHLLPYPCRFYKNHFRSVQANANSMRGGHTAMQLCFAVLFVSKVIKLLLTVSKTLLSIISFQVLRRVHNFEDTSECSLVVPRPASLFALQLPGKCDCGLVTRYLIDLLPRLDI